MLKSPTPVALPELDQRTFAQAQSHLRRLDAPLGLNYLQQLGQMLPLPVRLRKNRVTANPAMRTTAAK